MTTKSMKLEHISYLNINNSHLATKSLNVIHFKFIDPQFYQGRDKCVLQRNIVECESIFFFLRIYVIENIYICILHFIDMWDHTKINTFKILKTSFKYICFSFENTVKLIFWKNF